MSNDIPTRPVNVAREAADYRATATRLENLARGVEDEAARSQLIATARLLRDIADSVKPRISPAP